ncbi:hypothetical protein CAOG_02156 [Capsaspora owczarzaki ATCC 30864]|uniref:hypothetical protein n=1 Tax=Capsaspora owczarzaki (strain ATCC 30864) TaxID=595528 RepID=UPI0003525B09|nr:hypothetical protein CAOG_02156 [Capsaspora owczarzaki ATCC 30864]|eukprot:XP_004348906.2 hypothetical protein CAOG_02156 [Capsaspora owczarzaki ATCC 30864]
MKPHLPAIAASSERMCEMPPLDAEYSLSDRIKNSSLALNLSSKKLGTLGAQTVSQAFKFHPTLAKLVLSGNQIGDAGAQAIGAALRANRALTELILDDNQIGVVGVQAIAEALKSNGTLQSLGLSQNQIDDAGAQAIAEALQTCPPLVALDLRRGQIGDVGALAIAQALLQNTCLAELGLAQNRIGVIGAQAIAEALKSNTSLRCLRLFDNEIGDAGASAIAEALKVNTTLDALHLNSNQISDVGAQAIADALKSNSGLTYLNLERNEIGEDGAQAISKALEANMTLTSLYLTWNRVGDAETFEIEQAVQNNKPLTELNLNWSNQSKLFQYLNVRSKTGGPGASNTVQKLSKPAVRLKSTRLVLNEKSRSPSASDLGRFDFPRADADPEAPVLMEQCGSPNPAAFAHQADWTPFSQNTESAQVPLLDVNNVLDRKFAPYASCWCEENVYHLCLHASQTAWEQNMRASHTVNNFIEQASVVFISNPSRKTPIWCQRLSQPGCPVVWDYHVVLVLPAPSGVMVYDLDTTLGFPCLFRSYADEALRDSFNSLSSFHRRYRVVAASEFLKTFSSDRSHMFVGGKWQAPWPSWPLIQQDPTRIENNLPEYLSMTLTSETAWQPASQSTSAIFSPVVNSKALPEKLLGPPLARRIAHAGPYGVVLTEQEFFSHFSNVRFEDAVVPEC